MNCELIKENLCAYIDKELSKEQTELITRHIKDCTGCEQELNQLIRTVYLCSQLEQAEPPKELKQTIMDTIKKEADPVKWIKDWRTYAKLAAAVFVVGLMVSPLYNSYLRPNLSASDSVKTTQAPTPKMQEDKAKIKQEKNNESRQNNDAIIKANKPQMQEIPTDKPGSSPKPNISNNAGSSQSQNKQNEFVQEPKITVAPQQATDKAQDIIPVTDKPQTTPNNIETIKAPNDDIAQKTAIVTQEPTPITTEKSTIRIAGGSAAPRMSAFSAATAPQSLREIKVKANEKGIEQIVAWCDKNGYIYEKKDLTIIIKVKSDEYEKAVSYIKAIDGVALE